VVFISGGLMRLIIFAILLIAGASAQATDLTKLVGHFDGPNGCTVKIENWSQINADVYGVTFRTQPNGYPATFIINEENILSKYIVGFENKLISDDGRFIERYADMRIFLGKFGYPKHLVYKVWKVFWGVRIINSLKEYSCVNMITTDISDIFSVKSQIKILDEL